ncbi:glycosyltransferase family 2 protein [Sorangium sp. So ce1504]|uniref:hypothetical protein n=1 Tax=Sorangium sp. So ce1504 TaxID=3133337 RepID=UPI003F6084B7
MESLLWSLHAWDGLLLSAPLVHCLFLFSIFAWDHFYLLPRHMWTLAFGRMDRCEQQDTLPSAVLVIPSLLRKWDELASMLCTVESALMNSYPSELFIVISIDGYDDAPELYAELRSWAESRERRPGIWLYVTGTPGRRGKPMAIEHGVKFLRERVSKGYHPRFPEVYISTDADADLGPDALRKLVQRLVRRHPLTGWPARAVAGNFYLRGNRFWQGWRHFFTVEGQLTIQIAREYMIANVARHNLRPIPLCGVPGVFYCTWYDIFAAAPKFLAYIRTLRLRHWVLWWLGFPLPSFSASTVPEIPELIAGDTDDTVMAFMAILATFKNGRFHFEPPRTPLHALWAMLRALWIDRALKYEPEARVYTSSPTTIKSLFRQRRRWNTARIEVTGRFWRALPFYWTLGLPAIVILFLRFRYWFLTGLFYLYLPASFFNPSGLTIFVIGLCTCQIVLNSLLIAFALVINGDLRYWRLLLAIPFSPLHAFVFAFVSSFVGAVHDVLLFGNVTGFAPEATLIRGGSSRIALLFRVRRALQLSLRAILRGDVPFGAFWFGWRETPWTPNGYEGWTTGKKPGFFSVWHQPRPGFDPSRPSSGRGAGIGS